MLVDEEFALTEDGLPVRSSPRMLEAVTEQISPQVGHEVSTARKMLGLPKVIADKYQSNGYVHLWIAP